MTPDAMHLSLSTSAVLCGTCVEVVDSPQGQETPIHNHPMSLMFSMC